MVGLLLNLDHVPVGKTLKTAVLIVIGKREVQIGRVELGVDLLLQGLGDGGIDGHSAFPLSAWCTCAK